MTRRQRTDTYSMSRLLSRQSERGHFCGTIGAPRHSSRAVFRSDITRWPLRWRANRNHVTGWHSIGGRSLTNNNHIPELPTIFSTVVHMLADASSRSPEREALICGTETLTYAEYTRCVAAFAHRLIQVGARGERVAILLANSNDAADRKSVV